MSYEQPDYDNIFASSASTGELLTMPSASYLEGWGYLNEAEPPPMEFFNYLQNLADLRANYLFYASLVRKNSAAYAEGEIATSPNLSSRYVLICTEAGTTDESEPDLADVAAGDTVTDGGVTWLIRERAVNNIIVSDTEPTGQLCGDAWVEVE